MIHWIMNRVWAPEKRAITLLLTFCPKILGGGGDLRMMVFLENECKVMGIIIGDRDTQCMSCQLEFNQLYNATAIYY